MTSATSERGRRQPEGPRAGLRSRLAGRLIGAAAADTGPAAPALRGRPADTVETTVRDGETVADVAARHGVSTASVLALNALGWRTPVRAGQVLLVRPALRPASPTVSDDLHRHRVLPGESVATIAERHGIATAAVLLANGLSRGSLVRPGQQLVVPVPNPRRTGSGAVVLAGEMRVNAHLVADAGRSLGLPDDAIVVALAAAMQDSSLHNLGFGVGDAVGVFQQRGRDGWGPETALLDPYRAALAFFGDTDAGVRPPATGLLDIAGWHLMGVGEAAAAVQGTGTPGAYAKWERCAREWLVELDREAGRR